MLSNRENEDAMVMQLEKRDDDSRWNECPLAGVDWYDFFHQLCLG
jgi:hypothetical protein